MAKEEQLLLELQEQIKDLQHQAELIKTVLIVKEPNTVQASQAFEGLRKQVIASATERRSHLAQLVTFAVAVSRATSVDDLKPQVREWIEQSGIQQVTGLIEGKSVDELYEDISGEGLSGKIQILEPAYVDSQTGATIRLGRARSLGPTPAADPATEETATAPHDPKDVTA